MADVPQWRDVLERLLDAALDQPAPTFALRRAISDADALLGHERQSA